MRRTDIRLALAAVAVAACSFWGQASVCQAEIQQGRAVITDGDTVRAREQAIQDAERTLVEARVGVQVSGTTLVDKNVVLTDRIMSNSNGYVKLNRVFDEHQEDGMYILSIDAEVSTHAIETEMGKLKDRISALSDQSNRHGVLVALAGMTGIFGSQDDVSTYVRSRLEDGGFAVGESSRLNDYVQNQVRSGQPLSATQIRAIASSMEERGDAHAVLYGVFSTIQINPGRQGVSAVVQASFSMVGLDNNAVNSFADYFTAVGNDANAAVLKAQNLAARKAVESLSQKALLTEQRDTRGGVRHIKTLLVFQNITDRVNQKNAIVQALQGMTCRIVRMGFSSTGALQIFVDAMGYSTPGDFSNAIQQRLPNAVPGESAGGKMIFSF